MGRMSIMGIKGDIRVEWDPDVEEEVKAAEKQFNELIKKKWKAFRMADHGKIGEEIEEFDKYAERILLVPPMVGG